MNKTMKKILTACLAFVMVFVMLSPATVQAKTKNENLTLYKGEKVEYSIYGGDVKSVSTSNKKVVSAKKDTKLSFRVDMTAKKVGKSTVTIRTTRGTVKLKVTVKKLALTGKLTKLSDGYMLLSVKNNTKQTFESVYMTYTLKNSYGSVVEKKTAIVNDVVAGKSAYTKITYDNYSYDVDESQCSVKPVADNRSLSAVYKSISSKIKTSVSDSDDGSNLSLKIKTKNKDKKNNASGVNYIFVYDENGQMVDLHKDTIYLKAGEVQTDSIKVYYGPYNPCKTTPHYKIKTVAYTRIYK